MSMKLLVAAAVGAASVYGAVHQGMIEGPRKTFDYTKFAPTVDQLGCKAIATSMLFEDVPLGDGDKPVGKVKVLAERGTDQLSLKIDGAAQQLKVLTGAGLRIGTLDPEVMTIVRNDADMLVAIQITSTNADVFVIRLDRKTGNAVWSKTGTMLLAGLVGWSHYLECR